MTENWLNTIKERGNCSEREENSQFLRRYTKNLSSIFETVEQQKDED